MGKRSKSKKSIKQERAKHLKNVEVYEKTISKLDKELDSFGVCRKREHLEVLKEQLELTLPVEGDFASINRHQSYRTELSGICSFLLFDHIRLQNYAEAAIVYNDIMKYPVVEELRTCIEPFSNLLLLWTEGENDDRKDTVKKIIERKDRIDMITQDSIDIIRRPGARSPLRLLFLEKVLFELSRSPDRLFQAVEFLSLAMLKNAGKNEYTNQWVTLARTFLVYSYFDKLRFSKQVHHQAFLNKVRKISWVRPLHHQLLSRTGYLAYSVLDFYIFIYEKEEHFTVEETTDDCIDSLEKYIALRSEDAQNICYTCDEEDTVDHENLVCEGCRVVSYCCKDHQRLNYLHHEETGSRGLGHKHLCPLFKAYRRKKDNDDASKEGHFDRKFQRACKRFLRGTLEERTQNEYIYPVDACSFEKKNYKLTISN
ncbi:predicted protein [Chaetoceros tenuissimus]|uniref:MYND-type domain-containing protein n=1 Tax=Chaetoceros tenuissimus TaxID=426638 RepID=A0AAD3CHQ4_9STRA|nr:predicted protein [Chaetoceros tenuissimus]